MQDNKACRNLNRLDHFRFSSDIKKGTKW